MASLCLYALVSLLATWPLAAHITTHVPGDAIDDPALAWNLWWIKTRLIDHLQTDIFHAGWMFHPIDINLGFYTLTPLNGLLSLPLQTATSLTLTSNLVLLSSFVLGGFGVYLLTYQVWAHHFVRFHPRLSWAICWLAGAFYAFASAKLFYAGLGQFNIASSQWLPYCALYVWRTWHSRTTQQSWRNGVMAGLFLVFQAWAELTYATFLLLFIAFAYLFFSLARFVPLAPQIIVLALRWWRATQGMVAAALVFTLGIAPFLAAMLPDMAAEGDFFASGGGFADIFSADLMGYLVPTRLHPWLGVWVSQLPFANDKGQHIYLGYTLMALIVLGVISVWRRPHERITIAFWLLAFAGFWLLTLGPQVRWAGTNLPLPGPFTLMSELPFFSGNRYPSRYSVMLLLCAVILAARGLLWLIGPTRMQRRAAAILALAGVFFAAEHISTPLPLNDFRIPPIYQRLAAEPGDFAVLELPTGWRNGARVLGKSDALIMMQQWYQTSHGKRRLGGNTSRNPIYKFQYFSETPVAADLIALMISDRNHLSATLTSDYPALAQRVRAAAPPYFELLGIRFVTLHVEKSPLLLVKIVEDALPVTLVDEWQGTDWTGAPSSIRLYAVNELPSSFPRRIDMAAPAAHMVLAEGWSPLGMPGVGRFAVRQRVELLLPRAAQGATLTLEYAHPTSASYSFQNHSLGEHTGTVHTLALPSLDNDEPTPRLTLEFTGAPLSAAALVSSVTSAGSTGGSLSPSLTILAQSAGEEVGDFAHIWVNGVDFAGSERGYHLVALTPRGEVLESASFDTMRREESTRMAAWLEQWPDGTVVVGAAADSVSTEDVSLWDERAQEALLQLGVTGDLRGKLRWSHAFIGAQGAPAHSAVEDVQAYYPAAVWLGAPLNAPIIYGALQSITLGRTRPAFSRIGLR